MEEESQSSTPGGAPPIENGYLAEKPGNPRSPNTIINEWADRERGVVEPPGSRPDLSNQPPANTYRHVPGSSNQPEKPVAGSTETKRVGLFARIFGKK